MKFPKVSAHMLMFNQERAESGRQEKLANYFVNGSQLAKNEKRNTSSHANVITFVGQKQSVKKLQLYKYKKIQVCEYEVWGNFVKI